MNHKKFLETAIAAAVSVLIIILSVTAVVVFSGRKDGSPESASAVLWENRTQYIGDSVKVSALCSALTVPGELTAAGIELETDQHPYTLKVNYKASEGWEDSGDRNWIYRNSAVLFSLIGNADMVVTSIEGGEETVLYASVRRAIEDDLGKAIPVLQTLEELETYRKELEDTDFTYPNGAVGALAEKTGIISETEEGGQMFLMEYEENGNPVPCYVNAGRALILDSSGEEMAQAGLTAGSKVSVAFNGMIQETWPMKIPDVYVIRLEDPDAGALLGN